MENKALELLTAKYPPLGVCAVQIQQVYTIIRKSFEENGRLLICGNGGSAADAEHIAGELMKGFKKKRPLSDALKQKLAAIDPARGTQLSDALQHGLAAIPLVSHAGIITAVSNDNDPRLIFAQQAISLGRPGDVLMGISTSGNAENVICALVAAKAAGLKTVGLTGASGGAMKPFCDAIITVPAVDTPDVQELHLPVYHALCRMLEDTFFKN